MTFAEYVSTMHDPRRPMGPWGPLAGAAAYRIEGGPTRGEVPPSRFDRVTPARLAPQRTAHDAAARFRLEQHARAAEADKIVARLRRLR